jgi:hypothetical protein
VQVYEGNDVLALEVLLVLALLPLPERTVEKGLQRIRVTSCSTVYLEVLKFDSGKLDKVKKFDHVLHPRACARASRLARDRHPSTGSY